jgi:hypothetical protein
LFYLLDTKILFRNTPFFKVICFSKRIVRGWSGEIYGHINLSVFMQ